MSPRSDGLSPHAKGLAHLVVVYVVWGSTYLAIRLAVREAGGFPPFALGAARILIAGTALLSWGFARRARLRLSRGELATLVLAGLLMWPAANGLVNWAEQRADSSYAALLVGSIPIWSGLIESVLDRRGPSWRLVLSLLIGFGGVGLLTAPQLLRAGGIDAASVTALLVAPITWSIALSLQTRRPPSVTPLVRAGYLHLFGGLGFVVGFLLTREPLPTATPAAWGALGYLIVAGSILGFTSYIRALHVLPIGIVTTHAYVNPVIAVALGWLILHEPITPTVLGGTALILLGVWGVFRERRTPAAAA